MQLEGASDYSRLVEKMIRAAAVAGISRRRPARQRFALAPQTGLLWIFSRERNQRGFGRFTADLIQPHGVFRALLIQGESYRLRLKKKAGLINAEKTKH